MKKLLLVLVMVLSVSFAFSFIAEFLYYNWWQEQNIDYQILDEDTVFINSDGLILGIDFRDDGAFIMFETRRRYNYDAMCQ